MDGLGENNLGTTTGVIEEIGLAPAAEEPKTTAPELQQKLDAIQPGTSQEEGTKPEVNAETEQQLEQLKEAVTDQPGDSDLVKNLRQVLRDRTANYEQLNTYLAGQSQTNSNNTEAPQLSEREQKAVGLYDSLFEFDPEKGTPVTTGFVNQVYDTGQNLAAQVAFELVNKPLENAEGIEGWTIGHQLLRQFGLDPFKIDLLREVSNGKANLAEFGIVEVPNFVPPQYTEAYKALPHALRVDVDNYLSAEGSGAEDRKAAGLRVLQDRHFSMEREAMEQRTAQEAETRLVQETQQEAATILETTFNNILDSLAKNPVYESIKVSSEPLIDKSFKDSVIAQINALGDDNSILAKRAVTNLANYGVQVDEKQVRGLLTAIEKNANIIAKAERMQKMNPKLDYSPQIDAARERMTNATSTAIALGNRYFSTALEFVSNGGKLPASKQPSTVPNLENNGLGLRSNGNGSNKVLSPAELDAAATNFAKQNAELASGE